MRAELTGFFNIYEIARDIVLSAVNLSANSNEMTTFLCLEAMSPKRYMTKVDEAERLGGTKPAKADQALIPFKLDTSHWL
ncbi:hypothetical protein CU098_012646 [Rhizopus stolonifer]|uniref:Uncharacterized protein n=1 Tax=Rhizopus stolonifer TaxID=4846 RepID=A0A367KM24_RHIST|nr:hypothetical protein CU098_012646 [Rhizopus stolonifer]